jgi:hypothetical protein
VHTGQLVVVTFVYSLAFQSPCQHRCCLLTETTKELGVINLRSEDATSWESSVEFRLCLDRHRRVYAAREGYLLVKVNGHAGCTFLCSSSRSVRPAKEEFVAHTCLARHNTYIASNLPTMQSGGYGNAGGNGRGGGGYGRRGDDPGRGDRGRGRGHGRAAAFMESRTGRGRGAAMTGTSQPTGSRGAARPGASQGQTDTGGRGVAMTGVSRGQGATDSGGRVRFGRTTTPDAERTG